MQVNETTPILRPLQNGLSVFFAIICIVDVFGVFPVIALPKPVIDCGYYGIAVILVVCTVQIYTACLLGKCWNLVETINPNIKRKNRYPYSALAETAFGRVASYLVTFLVDVTVFGGAIPNLIVAAQNLQLLGLRVSQNEFDVSFCYWIIILGTFLCPILWLGSPKDMKLLCTISVGIVWMVFLLTAGCLLFTSSGVDGPEEEEVNFDTNFPTWKLVVAAYGIVAFQFDIHPVILTIQMDMKDKTKLSRALIGGFLVSLLMFGSTALMTVLRFGTKVKPSLLETLPTSVPLHFAAGLVAIQLCLTSAVSNSTLYQHMEDCLNISREFNHKRCILRTILTILAIVIAESVPRFDLVMSLIGGTLTGPLVFILPPLFYIKISRMHVTYSQKMEQEGFTNIVMTGPHYSKCPKENYDRDLSKYYENKFKEGLLMDNSFKTRLLGWVWNTKTETLFCYVIVIISVGATCLTTYLNISTAILSYGNFTKPCIYNISNALLYL